MISTSSSLLHNTTAREIFNTFINGSHTPFTSGREGIPFPERKCVRRHQVRSLDVLRRLGESASLVECRLWKEEGNYRLGDLELQELLVVK